MTIRKRGKGATSSKRSDTSKRQSAKKPTRRPRRAGKLPPKGPQDISLADAVELTQRYRKAAPASEHGGFFWTEGILGILAQPGCVGLRYYHGLGANGEYRLVLVGVDDRGNDITGPAHTTKSARSTQSASGAQALLLDHHWPCPPFCPSGSLL